MTTRLNPVGTVTSVFIGCGIDGGANVMFFQANGRPTIRWEDIKDKRLCVVSTYQSGYLTIPQALDLIYKCVSAGRRAAITKMRQEP